MKKIAPIAAFALLAVAFTSCKKDYKCVCTGSTVVADQTFDYNKQKKSDAEAACNTQNSAWGLAGGSCKLD